MKTKTLLFTLLLLGSAFFFNACQKENISEEENVSEIAPVENSATDPNIIAFQDAYRKYRISIAETLRENNVTKQKLKEALLKGNTAEIDQIISDSDIIANLQAMQPHLEKLNIDIDGCSTCPSTTEAFENYTVEEKEAALNKMLMMDESAVSRYCEEPQYTLCNALVLSETVYCMMGVGWTGAGAIGCLVIEAGGLTYCGLVHCYNDGPQTGGPGSGSGPGSGINNPPPPSGGTGGTGIVPGGPGPGGPGPGSGGAGTIYDPYCGCYVPRPPQ